MNKSQALKEAVRRWGKDAIIQDRGPRFASTPERRRAAQEARMELKAFRDLCPDRRAFRDFDDSLFSLAVRNRFSVGVDGGFCICIRGYGDSWEESFSCADALWGKKAA